MTTQETTPAAPARSLAQRMDALARANEIRSRRATLKRDVKAGREDLADVLEQVPDWLESAKVSEVMLTVPKLGRIKVGKILTRLAISPSKTMGGLSPRQRRDLVVALRGGTLPDRRITRAPLPIPGPQLDAIADATPGPEPEPEPAAPRLDAFARLRAGLED